MGNILCFVPRKTGTGQSRQRSRLAASVIIFPGVRYERHATIEAMGVTTTAGESAARRQKEPAPLR